MSQVTIKQLLEAGVHFGHQTQRWNPKMKKYIFGERNGIYIINLEVTLSCLDRALSFLKKIASEGKEVLLVGTKRQAQELLREAAIRCSMPYVDQRWLGGMLTNFETIRKSVAQLDLIDKREQEGDFAFITKKEANMLKKRREKLLKNLSGIRKMRQLPAALFVIDSKKEEIAVHEANKLGIPIVAVLDTNCDPDVVDYPLPGNDDAIRAIRLFCDLASDAVKAGSDEFHQRIAAEKAEEEERQAMEEAAAARAKEEAAAGQEEAGSPTEDIPEDTVEEKLAARFAGEQIVTEKDKIKLKKPPRKEAGRPKVK